MSASVLSLASSFYGAVFFGGCRFCGSRGPAWDRLLSGKSCPAAVLRDRLSWTLVDSHHFPTHTFAGTCAPAGSRRADARHHRGV